MVELIIVGKLITYDETKFHIANKSIYIHRFIFGKV